MYNNTVNKSECTKHVLTFSALNDSSWNVAKYISCVCVCVCFDGGSWSQEYCWASGEMR